MKTVRNHTILVFRLHYSVVVIGTNKDAFENGAMSFWIQSEINETSASLSILHEIVPFSSVYIEPFEAFF